MTSPQQQMPLDLFEDVERATQLILESCTDSEADPVNTELEQPPRFDEAVPEGNAGADEDGLDNEVHLDKRWGSELRLEDEDENNANTAKSTLWATNSYQLWQRQRHGDETPVEDLEQRVLGDRLAVFIIQLRKQDGSLYNRKSLACVARGLARHLKNVHQQRRQAAHDNHLDPEAVPHHRILAADGPPAFASFQKNLDGAMKRSTRAGLGYTHKARALPPDELKAMHDTIAKLPNTSMKVTFRLFVSLCLEVACRAREEIHDLMRDVFQFIKLPNGVDAVLFKRSSVQYKTFQGGFKDKEPLQDVILFPNPLPLFSFPEALKEYDVLRNDAIKRASDAHQAKLDGVPALGVGGRGGRAGRGSKGRQQGGAAQPGGHGSEAAAAAAPLPFKPVPNLFYSCSHARKAGLSAVVSVGRCIEDFDAACTAAADARKRGAETPPAGQPPAQRGTTGSGAAAAAAAEEPAAAAAAAGHDDDAEERGSGHGLKLKEARSWCTTKYTNMLSHGALGVNMLGAIVPALCFLAGSATLTTSHGMRRTFIKLMIKAHIPLTAIMKRTGHRTVEALQRYLNEDDLDETVAQAAARQAQAAGFQLTASDAVQSIVVSNTVQAAELDNLFRQYANLQQPPIDEAQVAAPWEQQQQQQDIQQWQQAIAQQLQQQAALVQMQQQCAAPQQQLQLQHAGLGQLQSGAGQAQQSAGLQQQLLLQQAALGQPQPGAGQARQSGAPQQQLQLQQAALGQPQPRADQAQQSTALQQQLLLQQAALGQPQPGAGQAQQSAALQQAALGQPQPGAGQAQQSAALQQQLLLQQAGLGQPQPGAGQAQQSAALQQLQLLQQQPGLGQPQPGAGQAQQSGALQQQLQLQQAGLGQLPSGAGQVQQSAALQQQQLLLQQAAMVQQQYAVSAPPFAQQQCSYSSAALYAQQGTAAAHGQHQFGHPAAAYAAPATQNNFLMGSMFGLMMGMMGGSMMGGGMVGYGNPVGMMPLGSSAVMGLPPRMSAPMAQFPLSAPMGPMAGTVGGASGMMAGMHGVGAAAGMMGAGGAAVQHPGLMAAAVPGAGVAAAGMMGAGGAAVQHPCVSGGAVMHGQHQQQQ